MPKFTPFKPIVPSNSRFAQQLTARSSDYDGQQALIDEMLSNQLTWHHMTKKHLLSGDKNSSPMDFVHETTEYVENLWREKVIIEFTEKKYLYYFQNSGNYSVGGIIGLTSLKDYEKGEIKIHEKTKPNRESFIHEIFNKTELIGEPVLLAYKGDRIIIDRDSLRNELILDFTSIDGIRHQIFSIDERVYPKIEYFFDSLSSLYVADGHHRTHTIYQYLNAKQQLEKGGLLSCIIHEDDMAVDAFHRKVKLELPQSEEIFLKKISNLGYEITRLPDVQMPSGPGEIVMLLENKAFMLKKEVSSDVIELESSIIKKLLRIEDSKSDKRIEFFPAKNVDKVRGEMGANQIVFLLFPESFKTIRNVADNGETMPPKSTYISPKFRGGMILHSLS